MSTLRDPTLAPIGWPLLSTPDADGGWVWPSLERSVADGLRSCRRCVRASC